MKGKNSAIIMYDVTNEETYADAKQWVVDVRKSGYLKPAILLLGNKTHFDTCFDALFRLVCKSVPGMGQ